MFIAQFIQYFRSLQAGADNAQANWATLYSFWKMVNPPSTECRCFLFWNIKGKWRDLELAAPVGPWFNAQCPRDKGNNNRSWRWKSTITQFNRSEVLSLSDPPYNFIASHCHLFSCRTMYLQPGAIYIFAACRPALPRNSFVFTHDRTGFVALGSANINPARNNSSSVRLQYIKLC